MGGESISPKALKANQGLHRYYTATCTSYPTLYPLRDGATWIQGRLRQNVFVMGCVACEKANCNTPFGRFEICTRSGISTSVLKKHQRSKLHTEATLSNGTAVLGAPSTECFRKVLLEPCAVNANNSSKKQVARLLGLPCELRERGMPL